jgi:RNA polymerase sigma-70 factor, ECF subfamily
LPYSNPTEQVLLTSLFWTERDEQQVLPSADNSANRSASDEELMTALKSRDREALARLFQRYSRLVFSIGQRILQNAGEAEEIVQEVFLFLYQRAELFDEKKGGAKAWLVQVAYHRSLDRKDYLYRRNFYFGTDAGSLADTLTGPEDVESELTSKLNRERLKGAFQSLSERQRLTLELFFFEELEFREIAARLDESLENIRHHYYRGLQKLRKDAFIKELRDKNQS